MDVHLNWEFVLGTIIGVPLGFAVFGLLMWLGGIIWHLPGAIREFRMEAAARRMVAEGKQKEDVIDHLMAKWKVDHSDAARAFQVATPWK